MFRFFRRVNLRKLLRLLADLLEEGKIRLRIDRIEVGPLFELLAECVKDGVFTHEDLAKLLRFILDHIEKGGK